MLRAAAKRGAAALRGGAQQQSLPIPVMPTRARGMAGASPPAARFMRCVQAVQGGADASQPHACVGFALPEVFAFRGTRPRPRRGARRPDDARAQGVAHKRGHGHGRADVVRARLGVARLQALGLCARGSGCNGPRRPPLLSLARPPLLPFARLPHIPLTGPLALRFWVLLRWKEDGATLIFGHAPHFQHEIEEEEKAQGILYAAGKKGGKSGH